MELFPILFYFDLVYFIPPEPANRDFNDNQSSIRYIFEICYLLETKLDSWFFFDFKQNKYFPINVYYFSIGTI